MATVAALAGWIWLHRLPAPARAMRRAGLGALRALAGMVCLLAGAQLAQRGGLLLATNWPLWPLALGGAGALEAVLALYRLERQTVPRRLGLALVSLRAAAVMLVAIILAQPVRSLDLSQQLHRAVAVLVDQSLSMQIRDTQLSASDKVRLAEALWQGPPRRHRLETAARQLTDLQGRLSARADALALLSQVRLDTRQEQLAAQRSSLAEEVAADQKVLDAQLQALAAPLQDGTPISEPVRSGLLDIKTRLTAKVVAALAAAAQTLDKNNVDRLGASQPALLSGLHQAAGELADVAPRVEAVAEGLDESFYASLPPEQKSAVEAAAAKSRLAQARQALLSTPPSRGQGDQPRSLMDRLREKYQLRFYTFDSKATQADARAWAQASPASAPTTAAATEAAAGGTDLAAALQKVSADLGGQQLAGAVIVSDGRHNAKTPIDSALRQLSLQQGAVCSLVVGSSRPPLDAAVVALEAPETIYARDKMFVNAEIKLDGLPGKTARVQLFDGATLKDTQTVTVPADAYRTHVQLSDTPETAGLHSYRVQVESFEGEAFADNNSYPLTLGVTEDRARLLLIESRPRWEFRYLKNLFAGRDNTVRLQYVLFDPDRIEDMPAAPPICASAARELGQVEASALPANEAEWMKFDVIILGDVAPSRFTGEQMACLRKFVADRGGTLVVVAGANFMPQAYASTPLGEMLPVAVGAGDLAGDGGAFHVALTAEGADHVIMRQALDPAQNGQLWTSFPEMYWHCPVTSVKPGARILAYARPTTLPPYMTAPVDAARGALAAPRTASTAATTGESPAAPLGAEDLLRLQTQFQKTHALIVTQNVAMGQVLLLGFDNTWRLRYNAGDTYHHKFWGQVMRWATASKLPAGTSLVKLGADRTRYSPHSRIIARAKIQRPDFSPMIADDVAVKVFAGGQLVLRKALSYQSDSPGLYWADLGELPSGAYRMELAAPSARPILEHEKVTEVATEFSVDPAAPVEQVELSADRGLLGRLAGATGGVVAELYEADRVLEPLGPGTLVTHQIRQYSLWDSPWLLVTIIILITAEWLLRKKAGLA